MMNIHHHSVVNFQHYSTLATFGYNNCDW
jgi:hypothetical protein